MEKVDYTYLARSVASLSGIPVRVYEGETELCRFFPVNLPKDPITLCRTEIMGISEHPFTRNTVALSKMRSSVHRRVELPVKNSPHVSAP